MTDTKKTTDTKDTPAETTQGGGVLDGKSHDAADDPAFGHAFNDQEQGVGSNLIGK